MQNREELGQEKATEGVDKRHVTRGGKKYNFQKGGGNKYHFCTEI